MMGALRRSADDSGGEHDNSGEMGRDSTIVLCRKEEHAAHHGRDGFFVAHGETGDQVGGTREVSAESTKRSASVGAVQGAD